MAIYWPYIVGKALSPFFAVLLVWAVAAPMRRLVQRRMREGRLKRFLLYKYNQESV